MNEKPLLKIMYKQLFSAIFIALALNCSFAQEQLKVTASSTKKDFQLSENIKINIKAVVQEGYHMNGNKVADEDLIPTSLNFTSNDFKLVKINWPPSHKFKFSFSETELDVYE